MLSGGGLFISCALPGTQFLQDLFRTPDTSFVTRSGSERASSSSRGVGVAVGMGTVVGAGVGVAGGVAVAEEQAAANVKRVKTRTKTGRRRAIRKECSRILMNSL